MEIMSEKQNLANKINSLQQQILQLNQDLNKIKLKYNKILLAENEQLVNKCFKKEIITCANKSGNCEKVFYYKVAEIEPYNVNILWVNCIVEELELVKKEKNKNFLTVSQEYTPMKITYNSTYRWVSKNLFLNLTDISEQEWNNIVKKMNLS